MTNNRFMVDKQSMEPEITVISVDNSTLMTSRHGGGVYKAQAKAIALYCEEKIKAHPHNKVALLPMGLIPDSTTLVEPTRDLDQIRFALKFLVYFGQPGIPVGLALCVFLSTELPKRRLLVFSGSRLCMDSDQLKSSAMQLKSFNVALDVVNFGIQYLPKTKKELLQAFVAAADNNGNSHFLYAPSGSRTSLGQQILSSPLAPGGLPMQEAKKKELEAKQKELEVKKMQMFVLKITELLDYHHTPSTHSSPDKDIAAHQMGLSLEHMRSTSSDKESALIRLKGLYALYMTTNLSVEEKIEKKKEKAILRMDKKEKGIQRKKQVFEDWEKKYLAFMRSI